MNDTVTTSCFFQLIGALIPLQSNQHLYTELQRTLPTLLLEYLIAPATVPPIIELADAITLKQLVIDYLFKLWEAYTFFHMLLGNRCISHLHSLELHVMHSLSLSSRGSCLLVLWASPSHERKGLVKFTSWVCVTDSAVGNQYKVWPVIWCYWCCYLNSWTLLMLATHAWFEGEIRLILTSPFHPASSDKLHLFVSARTFIGKALGVEDAISSLVWHGMAWPTFAGEDQTMPLVGQQ